MSNKGRPQQPPVQPQRFMPVPDRESRNTPPVAVNAVRIAGGIDSLILEFYHLDDVQLGLLAEQSERLQVNQNKDGVRLLPNGTVLVEARPLARVSVPASVAMDFVLQATSVIGTSIGRLKAQFDEAGTQFTALLDVFKGAMGGRSDDSSE